MLRVPLENIFWVLVSFGGKLINKHNLLTILCGAYVILKEVNPYAAGG